MNKPVIFFNFKNLYSIINFLFCASEKSTKSVDKFIINRARTQVVSFVFHRGSLNPFVLSDNIFFNWVQSLLSTKSAEYKNVSLAQCDSMCISRLTHWLFSHDFVFLKHVNSCIFFRRWTASSNQNLNWWKCNCGWALIELTNIWLV